MAKKKILRLRNGKVKTKFQDDQKNILSDLVREKIAKQMNESFEKYNKTLYMMSMDAPISVLCLPKKIEKALLAQGCDRIFSLININFTEIKGLSDLSIKGLTSRLDEFLSML